MGQRSLCLILAVGHNVNNFLLFSCIDSQNTDLKQIDYYLFSQNNASTLFLALLDGCKFFEVTFRCVEVEVKKDF